ncbi:phosphoadenylyl-sulfate reductase [bacterium]|nr:phosphoadenylyl-sulfate reductase [bacterium]
MNEIVGKMNAVDRTNPREILSAALDHFDSKVALSMSFQVGGCVMLDMINQMGREVDVVSLDTGRLPEETYECAEEILRRYGIEIKWVHPRHEVVESMIREKGMFSFRENVENRKECCGIRKVEPLVRALEPYDAWITGRRVDQSKMRSELSLVEEDPAHPGKIKVNPILHWTVGDLWEYVHEHHVPYNRLYDEGYLSIGCECCTRPCVGGEDERAGRWWGEGDDHKECGLHIGGSGI